jgi:hypothetical protein
MRIAVAAAVAAVVVVVAVDGDDDDVVDLCCYYSIHWTNVHDSSHCDNHVSIENFR